MSDNLEISGETSMNQTEIRKAFPTFKNDSTLVYLDNAATTQKPQTMLERIMHYYTYENANIHRGNYPLSNHALEIYEQSKQSVCDWIDANDREEIVYTKSSTEAVNLLAHICEGIVKPGNNIVTTELEHSSNYFPWKELCKKTGAEFRVAKANPQGCIEEGDIQHFIDKNTKIVTVTGMSNVTGFMPDLLSICKTAHKYGALLAVDGTQLVAHKKISVKKLDCDFMFFSAHKMYGPMGLGILYGKKSLLNSLPPFLLGGGMVSFCDHNKLCYQSGSLKYEAGTQNLSAAAGMKATIDFLQENQFDKLLENERQLAAKMRAAVSEIEGIKILNAQNDSPIFIFEAEHMGAYDLGVILGLRNIAIRCGAHCAYPFMKRIKKQSVCRISLGIYNNDEDLYRLTSILKECKIR